MRVLYITGAYPPMKCGVGDYTAKLVDGLSEIPGVVTGVLTSVDAAKISTHPDHYFPVMNGWGFTALNKVFTIIRQFQPDIVHLQYPSSFGRVFMPNLLPLACKARGIAMIQTWHEHPIYSQIANSLPNDVLVVVDPRYPAAYRQPYRALVCHKPCTYIPIGANIPRMTLSLEQKRQIRAIFDSGPRRMLVYWGFASHLKGIEQLFQIADPATDRLVLVCDLDPKDTYQAKIIRLTESTNWRGKCFVTGYKADRDVASILASADVAIFPFIGGSTPRNGSVLAARLQGTFVVTTHAELRGYKVSEHTFYAAPGDVAGIREAMDVYAGKYFEGVPTVAVWDDIATRHYELYERIVHSSRKKR